MKKILFVSFIVVFLGACTLFGGGSEIKSLNVSVADGEKNAVDYCESNLRVTPDYESRTLSVDYSKNCPNKVSADKDEEAALKSEEIDPGSSGVLGGENFDRFESVVKWFYGNDMASRMKAGSSEGVVTVSVDNLDGKVSSVKFASWDEEFNGLDDLKLFFTDLSNLFSKNVY